MTEYRIDVEVPAVREGHYLDVSVVRSDTSRAKAIALSFIPGTAASNDFRLASPNVSIPDRVDLYFFNGQAEATFRVFGRPDELDETNESFEILLEDFDFSLGNFFEVARASIQVLDPEEAFSPLSLDRPNVIGFSPGQTFVHDFTASSSDYEERNGLTYSLVGGANIDEFRINSQTGVLNLKSTPVPGDTDALEVEVEVSDDDGNVDTQVFEVLAFSTQRGLVYLSNDAGRVYTWNPKSDRLEFIGNTGVDLTDVAISPNGVLYGITQTDLYKIDPVTADVFRVGPLAGELFFGVNALTDAQGFDIGPDGVGRISSGNSSVVAVVDLETGAVSNPFGPSLGQGATSSGDLWIEEASRYFVTTNSFTLLSISESTFGEGIADNDFISNDDIQGVVSLAAPSGDQRADLIGFSGNAYFSLAEGAQPALPGLELGTLPVSGSITGAARLLASAPTNEAPSINIPSTMAGSIAVPENTTAIIGLNPNDDADSEGDGLTYTITGSSADVVTIDQATGSLSFVSPPDFENPFDSQVSTGVVTGYEFTVTVTDSGGLSDSADFFVRVIDTDDDEADEPEDPETPITTNAAPELTPVLDGSVVDNGENIFGTKNLELRLEEPWEVGERFTLGEVFQISDADGLDDVDLAFFYDLGDETEIEVELNGEPISTEDTITFRAAPGQTDFAAEILDLVTLTAPEPGQEIDFGLDIRDQSNAFSDRWRVVLDAELPEPVGSAPVIDLAAFVDRITTGAPDETSVRFTPDVVEVTDPDGDLDTITFSFEQSGDGGFLRLDDGSPDPDDTVPVGSNGLDRVSYVAGPSAGSTDILVVAVDGAGNRSEETIRVNVQETAPENRAPVFNITASEAQTLRIPENSRFIFDLAATDPDGDALTYSINGPSRDLVDFDSDTGVLSFVTPPDFENPFPEASDPSAYEFAVVANDGSRSSSVAFRVAIDDVNEDSLDAGFRAFSELVSFSSGVNENEVLRLLEEMYRDSQVARDAFDEAVENGWSVTFTSGVSWRYFPFGDKIQIDGAGSPRFHLMKNGDVLDLLRSGPEDPNDHAIKSVILHEFAHFLDDKREGAFSNGFPKVERIASSNSEFPFTDANFDYSGNGILLANAYRREVGDLERGSYLTNVPPLQLPYYEELQKLIDRSYDRAIIFREGGSSFFDEAIETVGAAINFFFPDNSSPDFEVFSAVGRTTPSDDLIYGWNNWNRISTGPGEDMLIGNVNRDELYGGEDDDRLVGLDGSDLLDGGPGTDTAVYRSPADSFRIFFDAQGQLFIERMQPEVDPTGFAPALGGRVGIKDTLVDVEFAEFSDGIRIDLRDVEAFVLDEPTTGEDEEDPPTEIRLPADQFDGVSVENFDDADALVFVDVNFDQRSLTVTVGSAILDIDFDLDGIVDSTVVLQGDFDPDGFRVEMIDDDTRITYAGPNKPPEFDSPAAFPVEEGGTVVGSVSAQDADSERVAYAITGGADADLFDIDPATGALGFKAPPVFADPQDDGGDNVYDLAVSADDGDGGVTEQAITVTVAGSATEVPNIPPSASAIDAGSVAENAGVVAIDLLGDAAASDSDGGTLGVANVSVTDQNGAAVVFGLTGAALTIDPTQFASALASGESATLTVTYDVTDGQGGVMPNTGQLVVDGLDGPFTWYLDGDGDGFGVDDPATNQSDYAAPAGTSDVAGDADDADATVFPGALEINDGKDNDQDGDVDEDNSAPVVAGETYSTDDGETLTVAAAAGLLANDSDPDASDTIFVQSFTAAGNGNLSVTTDGSFEYTPDAGFVGAETITYTVSDGTATATGEVTIDVTKDTGPNIIDGTPGNDALVGTEGDDLFKPVGGSLNTLTGMGGADVFEFRDFIGNGTRDVANILDFDVAMDKLGLDLADVAASRGFAGNTYLNLAGGENDMIVLQGVNSIDEFNFV